MTPDLDAIVAADEEARARVEAAQIATALEEDERDESVRRKNWLAGGQTRAGERG